MTLDARLLAALGFVRWPAHADIGSDHARLPVELLRSGRVERGVIVEKTRAPLEVAREAVRRAGLTDRVDVRLGDGFAPLAPGEVDGASLTGMGWATILGILGRADGRLPPDLVLQPNNGAEALRAWARRYGYHLADERLAPGFWAYPVLHLRRGEGDDPAYADLPPDLALRWGPWLLRRRDDLLVAQVQTQVTRLEAAARHGRPEVLRDLDLACRALTRIERG